VYKKLTAANALKAATIGSRGGARVWAIGSDSVFGTPLKLMASAKDGKVCWRLYIVAGAHFNPHIVVDIDRDKAWEILLAWYGDDIWEEEDDEIQAIFKACFDGYA
jgi:hypothetical protein